MTSKEAIKQLYSEREYLLGDKVAHKSPIWCESIKHYDNINKCLRVIQKDLEVLELLKPIIKETIDMSNHGIPNNALLYNINENKLLKEWLENEKD